jgi:3-deoxy-manno-octulosonate cytidylyltransferase (CMP-KDO synthetase)
MSTIEEDLNDVAIIIPARYKSTRFPGKPLAKILGKPMVVMVAEKAASAVGKENVFVATDTIKIANVVRNHGFTPIMTASSRSTGTDRVAEASSSAFVHQSIIINLQGDEPLIHPSDIRKVIKAKKDNINTIVSTMSRIPSYEKVEDRKIVKVVTSLESMLLYASRNPIPATKNGNSSFAYKHGGIYAFTKQELALFNTYTCKTPLEAEEDIEVLRFLESGIPVKMVKVNNPTVAVDHPEDIAIVENILRS